MTDPDLSAVLADLWSRYAGLAQERADALERHASALRAGREQADLRAEAASAAHKLAGALGTYGRSGSADAARLQELLERGGDHDEVLALIDRVRAAVHAP